MSQDTSTGSEVEKDKVVRLSGDELVTFLEKLPQADQEKVRRVIGTQYVNRRADWQNRSIFRRGISNRVVVGRQWETVSGLMKAQTPLGQLVDDTVLTEADYRGGIIAAARARRKESWWKKHWPVAAGMLFFSVVFLGVGFSPFFREIGYLFVTSIGGQVAIALLALLLLILVLRRRSRGGGEA